MTRKKKTRSLSRIHQVKTGSIKKLKREAGTDRQSGKRTSKKNKSVFEKFLESNPEAKKQLKVDQEAAARKKEATQRVDSQKDREHKKEIQICLACWTTISATKTCTDAPLA